MPLRSDKLWSGRFTETASASLDQFWSSIRFDQKLFPFDIRGSIAHARMLGATGIVHAQDAEAIVTGLESIAADYQTGKISFSEQDEDVHMNVERLLRERIGAPAGKLHTARSRNDQVAVDMHMFVRAHCVKTSELLARFQQVILQQARTNIGTIMPGYTHLQRAQPVLFAHHIMVYFWMMQRDIERMQDCYRRANLSPLGAGAMAGTTFPIDRRQTAQELGFDDVYANSMDAVSDRDYVVEHLAANALIAAHLSRLCEEVILWTSTEFGFVSLSDAFCSGSSMMPQKKNADLAELVRGKTGRVFGALTAMLTTLKGTPLTYNKDFQEDKEGLFDSIDTVQGCLLHLADMIASLRVNEERTRRAAEDGFMDATDAADYLAKRGVPFREAHEITGQLVRLCLDTGRNLKDVSLPELQKYSAHFADDFYQAIALTTIVDLRKSEGGTAPDRVREQLRLGEDRLSHSLTWIEKTAPHTQK